MKKKQVKEKPSIGVFGGSGFYSFLEKPKEKKVKTPFGPPSDVFHVGKTGGKTVAFLPRHGRKHSIPAHKVNYRANLWAMKELGVQRIISPFACGSLQPEIRPGDFVVVDQFFDRTRGRQDTFFDGPKTMHVSTAFPYCPQLRELAVQTCKDLGERVHERGTVVVIQGPRFSSWAESNWFSKNGWHLVNMTQYPEVALAKELDLCFVGIGLATDWDAGVGGVAPVTHAQVLKIFNEKIGVMREVLFELVKRVPEKRSCKCCEATKEAGG